MKQKLNYFNFLLSFILPLFLLQCKTSVETSNTETTVDSISWAILPFEKVDSLNPILTPGDATFLCPILKKEVKWEEKDVFNPAAIVRDNKVFLLYRAEDKVGKFNGTSRLGLAESPDGLHFTKMKEPVFYPDNDSLKHYEWEGGVEDPRVVESEDGTYIMTYTSYDGTVARLMLATSTDLRSWKKYGTVLKGKYKDTWSKSGAIVASLDNDKVKATKIDGKYWMYFGDTDLFMVSSTDLINWTPVEENGKLKSVLQPRKGYFDSRLVESGPYALLKKEGVVLIYNGMNLDGEGKDPSLAAGAYCGGQALFDKNDPTKLINRLEKNFIRPDKDYEIGGQVNQVCFLEGMVRFQSRWFLYYGTADSKIAVAVSKD
jgi:beta-1,2-mannosidase